jgi:hypothetical protein
LGGKGRAKAFKIQGLLISGENWGFSHLLTNLFRLFIHFSENLLNPRHIIKTFLYCSQDHASAYSEVPANSR